MELSLLACKLYSVYEWKREGLVMCVLYGRRRRSIYVCACVQWFG